MDSGDSRVPRYRGGYRKSRNGLVRGGFIAVSVGVLLTLRPFTRKYVNGSKHPTNADRVLGTVCPVTEDIDNIRGTGSVSVDGKVWSARTRDGANIEKGTLVRPVSIEGVKLIVERA